MPCLHVIREDTSLCSKTLSSPRGHYEQNICLPLGYCLILFYQKEQISKEIYPGWL